MSRDSQTATSVPISSVKDFQQNGPAVFTKSSKNTVNVQLQGTLSSMPAQLTQNTTAKQSSHEIFKSNINHLNEIIDAPKTVQNIEIPPSHSQHSSEKKNTKAIHKLDSLNVST